MCTENKQNRVSHQESNLGIIRYFTSMFGSLFSDFLLLFMCFNERPFLFQIKKIRHGKEVKIDLMVMGIFSLDTTCHGCMIFIVLFSLDTSLTQLTVTVFTWIRTLLSICVFLSSILESGMIHLFSWYVFSSHGQLDVLNLGSSS